MNRFEHANEILKKHEERKKQIIQHGEGDFIYLRSGNLTSLANKVYRLSHTYNPVGGVTVDDDMYIQAMKVPE